MKTTFEFKKLIVPGVVMLAFWGIALWGYLAAGYTKPLIMFGYIGTSLGVGLGLYAVLPKRQKPLGRRLTLFLVGLFLVGFAIFLGYENVGKGPRKTCAENGTLITQKNADSSGGPYD